MGGGLNWVTAVTSPSVSEVVWHQKKATENHNKTTALERSVMNYLGEGLKIVLHAQPQLQLQTVFSSYDPMKRFDIIALNDLGLSLK